MATKLYPSATVAAPVTPPSVQGANWTVTASLQDKSMTTTKVGDSAATSRAVASNGKDLFYRLVSPPLAATTAVSGTLRGVHMVASSGSGANVYLYAYVMQPDGSVRGSVSGPFNQNTTEGSIITSTETGRNVGVAGPFFTLTSVTPSIGDRLVIEAGMTNLFIAQTSTMRIGGTGSDLTSGSTDTSLPTWWEYSANLTFNPEPSGGRAFILF